MQYKKALIALFLAVDVLIIAAAISAVYDTDNTFAAIARGYGDDFVVSEGTEVCENDVDGGLSTKAVSFGVKATGCHDAWFVLFNIFPIHTMDAGDSSTGEEAATPAETDTTTYRVGSYLTFQVPNDGFTMLAGSTEGKYSVRVTDDAYDKEITLTFVEDRSQTEDAELFDLPRLTLEGVLKSYSVGYIAESCDPQFADEGAICNMAGSTIVEAVPIDLQSGSAVDTYLVLVTPVGMRPIVGGIADIANTINLNPSAAELASATEVAF